MTAPIQSPSTTDFNALSDHWWDPEGPLKTLHHINPTRLTFIKKYQTLHGTRLLDVGCGAGLLSETLAKAGAKVTAIDIGSNLIEVAQQHALTGSLSIDYQCTNLEKLLENFSTGSLQPFETIVCMELLEHVPKPSKFLKQLVQLLQPNGTLFVSTLNRTPRSYLFAIVFAEYLFKLLPIGTHHYQDFIQPFELNNWLYSENYYCEAMAGITYQPLFKSAQLTPDLGVNYIAVYRASSD